MQSGTFEDDGACIIDTASQISADVTVPAIGINSTKAFNCNQLFSHVTPVCGYTDPIQNVSEVDGTVTLSRWLEETRSNNLNPVTKEAEPMAAQVSRWLASGSVGDSSESDSEFLSEIDKDGHEAYGYDKAARGVPKFVDKACDAVSEWDRNGENSQRDNRDSSAPKFADKACEASIRICFHDAVRVAPVCEIKPILKVDLPSSCRGRGRGRGRGRTPRITDGLSFERTGWSRRPHTRPVRYPALSLDDDGLEIVTDS